MPLGRNRMILEKNQYLYQGWCLRQPAPSQVRQPTPDRSATISSFCRVDTALTETICEFRATVESRLADSFLSRGYGRDVFLSDSLRVLAATSKRFYSGRNCRQFQHVEVHGTTHRYRSCVTRNREIVEREPKTFIHVKEGNTFAPWVDLSSYQYPKK